MKLDQARRFALSLPQTSEEPHFRYTSFRAGCRIFATAHPDGSFLHVFIPEEARAAFVQDLLRKAWEYKATKKPTRPRTRHSART